MKKLILIAVILLCAVPAYANWNIQLEWKWDVTPQAGDVFEVFESDSSGSFDFSDPFLTIPVSFSTGSDYQASEVLDLSQSAGQTVRRYFVVRAKRGGAVSGLSNEVYHDFDVGLDGPYDLTVTVTVIP